MRVPEHLLVAVGVVVAAVAIAMVTTVLTAIVAVFMASFCVSASNSAVLAVLFRVRVVGVLLGRKQLPAVLGVGVDILISVAASVNMPVAAFFAVCMAVLFPVTVGVGILVSVALSVNVLVAAFFAVCMLMVMVVIVPVPTGPATVCMFLYIYICVYACMYVCMYMYVCVCACRPASVYEGLKVLRVPK